MKKTQEEIKELQEKLLDVQRASRFHLPKVGVSEPRVSSRRADLPIQQTQKSQECRHM